MEREAASRLVRCWLRVALLLRSADFLCARDRVGEPGDDRGNGTPRRAGDLVGEALDADCDGVTEDVDDRLIEATEELAVDSSSML